MTEPQPMYQVPTMAVTKTYSLTLAHIGKVTDMADRLQVSQGDIVRQAIDLLWDKLQAEEAERES